MGNRKTFEDGYDTSYAYQREVCQTRRIFNLPCRNCIYLKRCSKESKIIERLNNDLSDTKIRTP